eukprot:2606587-Pyramimonas_sp.AAC.1
MRIAHAPFAALALHPLYCGALLLLPHCGPAHSAIFGSTAAHPAMLAITRQRLSLCMRDVRDPGVTAGR